MKTPLHHALVAEAYIIGIVSFLSYVMPFFADEPDTIFAPITALSLLVLSVATMAYLFFAVPVREYLDGNKEHAVQFLMATIAWFGALTLSMAVASMVFSHFVTPLNI